MIEPQRLIEQPFTFTQQPLLTGQEFIRAASERHVKLRDEQLEAFHRLRLLVPLFRVARDGRAIAALARSGDIFARSAAGSHLNDRSSLMEAASADRLFDPAAEAFISRSRLDRQVGELKYRASDYIYSPYQLLALPMIADTLPYLHLRSGQRPRLEVASWWPPHGRALARDLREVAIAASALEPAYLSDVTHTLRIGEFDQLDRFERWRKQLRPGSLVRFLKVSPVWLRQRASGLLNRADGIDPLGDWARLVREADPSSWETLRGRARSAIDFRIAAELLLRYYEELGRAGRAQALPQSRGRFRGEFDSRLKPRGRLDRVLTDFGLSPHPRVLLVVEGDTEKLLFPRLMMRFGIRTDEDYIAVQNAEGVPAGLGPLLGYAAAPRTEPDDDGRYLRLLRPPTHVLVITDAEHPMTTAEARERKRQNWIDRLLRTLPKEHRTPAARVAIATLVHVETWDGKGQSFEFAHFTDRQIARAIAAREESSGGRTVAQLTAQVAAIRASSGNLKTVLGRGSKLVLADSLWPELERKIGRAERSKTEARIPIIRVLDHAIELGHRHRRNVVIPLGGE